MGDGVRWAASGSLTGWTPKKEPLPMTGVWKWGVWFPLYQGAIAGGQAAFTLLSQPCLPRANMTKVH